MRVRTLRSDGNVRTDAELRGLSAPADGWIWIDIRIDEEVDDAVQIAADLGLDELAVRDAVEDDDLPKVDDFGDHMLVVLHGLRDDDIETYELDCFITTDRHVVTMHHRHSPSVEALWSLAPKHPELLSGTAGELLARLADVTTRRFLGVLEVFEDRAEELVAAALDADPSLIGEVTAVRSDLSAVRKAVYPQREVLDTLRTTSSPLIGQPGRRRFADAFDVAQRATSGVDAARVSLVETVDAYRGAEAREATEVGRVLTVYAAIMLPLSLIAGFFGMNFENLPGTGNGDGWVWVTLFMGALTIGSLMVFVSAGWIRPPAGRAGRRVGRGLIDAAKLPATLAGALFVRSSRSRRDA